MTMDSTTADRAAATTNVLMQLHEQERVMNWQAALRRQRDAVAVLGALAVQILIVVELLRCVYPQLLRLSRSGHQLVPGMVP